MFKKLLGNLPFSPSLVNQVAFYAKRLHRETRIRTISLLIMACAIVVQSFAVISPPEQSLALSENDIIPGGFSQKEQAVTLCNQNAFNFKEILEYYGISCANLNSAATRTIKSTDYDKNLYSMGRLPYGKQGEYSVPIEGKTYYMRFLWSWDSGPYSPYKALVGKNKSGQTFMILYDCGNLVVIGKPTPPPPDDECPNIAGIQTDKKQCDLCANKPGVQSTLAACDVCPKKSGIQTKLEDCDVCPNLPGIQKIENGCLPCPDSEDKDDKTSCLVLSKKARNITQNISEANGTTAKAGDEIEYTLSVRNTGKVTVKKFTIEEPVVDILEYADITNKNGATLTSNNTLRWPTQEIKSKELIQKTFRIKIKNPLPATPKASSNPGSYDLTMTNVYGASTVNIKLPSSPIKTTEQVVEKLPNTGPGESLAVAFIIASFMGYFLARSRLMAKELDYVKQDALAGGGY